MNDQEKKIINLSVVIILLSLTLIIFYAFFIAIKYMLNVPYVNISTLKIKTLYLDKDSLKSNGKYISYNINMDGYTKTKIFECKDLILDNNRPNLLIYTDGNWYIRESELNNYFRKDIITFTETCHKEYKEYKRLNENNETLRLKSWGQ